MDIYLRNTRTTFIIGIDSEIRMARQFHGKCLLVRLWMGMGWGRIWGIGGLYFFILMFGAELRPPFFHISLSFSFCLFIPISLCLSVCVCAGFLDYFLFFSCRFSFIIIIIMTTVSREIKILFMSKYVFDSCDSVVRGGILFIEFIMFFEL